MPHEVIIWSNGMCMVFDEHGKQLPEYQGRWIEMRKKILESADARCTFRMGEWRGTLVEVKRKSLESEAWDLPCGPSSS